MNKLDLSGINFPALHEAMEQDSKNRPEWDPPKVLPPSWQIRHIQEDGAFYISKSKNLKVVLSCSYEEDGNAWLHMSVSNPNRIPTWEELVHCKEIFLGNREAYKIIPPKEKYVNIHAYVLHLFALLENKPALPDFTRGTGSL